MTNNRKRDRALKTVMQEQGIGRAHAARIVDEQDTGSGSEQWSPLTEQAQPDELIGRKVHFGDDRPFTIRHTNGTDAPHLYLENDDDTSNLPYLILDDQTGVVGLPSRVPWAGIESAAAKVRLLQMVAEGHIGLEPSRLGGPAQFVEIAGAQQYLYSGRSHLAIYGVNGSGKTRLARKIVAEANAAGWNCWGWDGRSISPPDDAHWLIEMLTSVTAEQGPRLVRLEQPIFGFVDSPYDTVNDAIVTAAESGVRFIFQRQTAAPTVLDEGGVDRLFLEPNPASVLEHLPHPGNHGGDALLATCDGKVTPVWFG